MVSVTRLASGILGFCEFAQFNVAKMQHFRKIRKINLKKSFLANRLTKNE